MEFKNQTDLFNHVWNTRKHISEISGKNLYPPGHWLFFHQFAHVLSKGAFPRYKLNPDNIMLMLPEEHSNQEQYEKYQARKDELKAQYSRESKLPQFKHK